MELETTLLGGKWYDLLKDILPQATLAKLENEPTTRILSGIVLSMLVGRRIAKKYCNIFLPEISIEGKRRCVAVIDGVRCSNYAEIPICDCHFEEATMLGNFFRNAKLRETYEHMLTSPHKMQLDSELAMMRLMLAELVKKLDHNEVPFELIVSTTTMCEKIGNMVEKMSKVSALTPEAVDRMFEAVINIIAEHVPAEKLSTIADQIQKVQDTQSKVCNIPYEPGNVVNGKRITSEMDLSNPQIIALLETAKRMGVEP